MEPCKSLENLEDPTETVSKPSASLRVVVLLEKQCDRFSGFTIPSCLGAAGSQQIENMN